LAETVKVYGKIKLSEIPEFLDSEDVTMEYMGIRLPKISRLTYEAIPLRKEDETGIHYITRFPKLVYKHVLLWIKKAKSEKTGFDKFFALWVAFNSFYDFHYERIKPTGKEKDEERLKKLIEDLTTEDEATTLLQMLSPKIETLLNTYYEIKLNWGRRDIKAELQKEFGQRKFNKHTLKLLILALYGIRNNLFHGSKPLTDRQERMLNTAFDILLPIFSLLLIKYLICYHSGDAPDELCPCKTRG